MGLLLKAWKHFEVKCRYIHINSTLNVSGKTIIYSLKDILQNTKGKYQSNEIYYFSQLKSYNYYISNKQKTHV